MLASRSGYFLLTRLLRKMLQARINSIEKKIEKNKKIFHMPYDNKTLVTVTTDKNNGLHARDNNYSSKLSI